MSFTLTTFSISSLVVRCTQKMGDTTVSVTPSPANICPLLQLETTLPNLTDNL